LKSLQSDQTTIAGYEVELNDLKGAANYAMSSIPIPEEGEQQSIVDRLELEVDEATNEVMENIDFEGDGGASGDGGRQ
jgi:hypothetical protein